MFQWTTWSTLPAGGTNPLHWGHVSFPEDVLVIAAAEWILLETCVDVAHWVADDLIGCFVDKIFLGGFFTCGTAWRRWLSLWRILPGTMKGGFFKDPLGKLFDSCIWMHGFWISFKVAFECETVFDWKYSLNLFAIEKQDAKFFSWRSFHLAKPTALRSSPRFGVHRKKWSVRAFRDSAMSLVVSGIKETFALHEKVCNKNIYKTKVRKEATSLVGYQKTVWNTENWNYILNCNQGAFHFIKYFTGVADFSCSLIKGLSCTRVIGILLLCLYSCSLANYYLSIYAFRNKWNIPIFWVLPYLCSPDKTPKIRIGNFLSSLQGILRFKLNQRFYVNANERY